MLDGETTLEYIKAAQSGDEYAKEQLIVHNMPLIKSIVARYRGNATEYEDLIQLGSMGLVKAINNFDTGYNVRFSTYAVPMIAGEIKRFIRDDGAIKVSRDCPAIYKDSILVESGREVRFSCWFKSYNPENQKANTSGNPSETGKK